MNDEFTMGFLLPNKIIRMGGGTDRVFKDSLVDGREEVLAKRLEVPTISSPINKIVNSGSLSINPILVKRG